MGEARREAMILGLKCGLVWIISFLFSVYSFPSSLSQFGVMFGLVSIPLVGVSIRRYRRRMTGMSWLMALWMSWTAFMGSALICTIVQYVYFAFLDNGHLMNGMMAMVQDREVVSAYSRLGMSDLLSQMRMSIEELSTFSAKDLTVSLGGSNLFIALFLSPICSLFALSAGRNRQQD